MAIENKLGLDGIELMRLEEKISKRRACELRDIKQMPVIVHGAHER